MTLREVEEQLRAFERKHRLLTITVEGWSVWPLFRFNVARLMAGDAHHKDQAQRLTRKELLGLILRDLRFLVFPRRARLLVKTLSSGLVEQRGGRFADIWFDDLLAATGSYVKLDSVNNRAFLERRGQALIRPDASTHALDSAASLLARFFVPSEAREAAARLHAALRDELGERALPLQKLVRHIAQFAWGVRLYRYLLRRVKPEILLIGWSAGSPLVAAAKEAGCTVVEFQHGIMLPFYGTYAWPADANEFRAQLPVPDRLFVYGEHWQTGLHEEGFWGDALRVVGSLRHEYHRRQHRQRRAGGKRLLVTTQGFDQELLIGFIREAALEARRRGVELGITIKTHPAYEADKSLYSDAFCDLAEVRVVAGPEEPSTFQLLSESDFHASISSAVHYDALGLGVPTLVMPFRRHEAVLPLCEKGHATLVRTPGELVEVVARHAPVVDPGVSDYYFRDGAIQNMKRELGLE